MSTAKLHVSRERYLTKRTNGVRGGGESDWQTVQMEGAMNREHVLSRPLSVRVARSPSECTFCTLRVSQLAKLSLTTR